MPHSAESSSLDGTKPTQQYKESSLEDNDEEGKRFERATIRKVDLRLLPIISALYSVSLIDRSNISVARIVGMAIDLRLFVSNRYSIITLVFFAPYVVFELPSNLLIRKIGVRNHLAAIGVLWGAAVLGSGFVETWEQLAVCRVLLGLMEAGFFPACVYLISAWYTRTEIQKRLAFFFLVSLVLSGFSSIISYGFSRLDGAHGIAGWSYIMICWGAITMALGILAYFVVVDFPDSPRNTFLTEAETKLVIDRINKERGDAIPDKLTMKKVLSHLYDWRIWAFGVMFMSTTVPSYAFSYFLPVILTGGGFSIRDTLLLIAPAYVFSAVYIWPVAYMADRLQKRGLFIMINALICLVGCCIMGYADKIGVRYFGVYVAIAGCQANLPGIIAWSANSTVTQSKRAVSSAIVVGMGGVGGIVASLIFRQEDSPRYIPGVSASIGLQGLIIAIVLVLGSHFKRENAKADKGQPIVENEPSFRYTV